MRVGIVVLELLIDAGAACAALGLLGAGSAAFTAARRRFIGGDGGLAAPSPHGQPHGGDGGRSGDSPSSREPAPGS